MYKAFFRLTATPFNLSPDPAFLYRSRQHEEALANLIYGVQSHKGFVLLTGEVGTGKTTMLECLRDHLTKHNTPFGCVFNTSLTPNQLLEMIAHDFGLRCKRDSKTEVLIALNAMLMEHASRGVTTALIVDEAQNLSWDVLEEIRMLGNLESRRGKLLQIILAGQPELDAKLSDPSYRQLKQRIALRCTLRPFSEYETSKYILTRMARAGMPDQTVFSEEVMVAIHRYTSGIPRLINSLCDNLLISAFALESRTVNAALVDEVANEMQLDWITGRGSLRPNAHAGSAAEPYTNGSPVPH